MPKPRLPLSATEYETVSELLQACWQIVRRNADGSKLLRRLIEQLKMCVPLTPVLARCELRDLTDAEIDIAVEQLDGAANIYAGRRPGSARASDAENRLRGRLLVMRGRVPDRDDAAEPCPVMGELVQPATEEYRISQALLDLYTQSTGKAFCASDDDLIGWINSNRGTAVIQAACNRP